MRQTLLVVAVGAALLVGCSGAGPGAAGTRPGATEPGGATLGEAVATEAEPPAEGVRPDGTTGPEVIDATTVEATDDEAAGEAADETEEEAEPALVVDATAGAAPPAAKAPAKAPRPRVKAPPRPSAKLAARSSGGGVGGLGGRGSGGRRARASGAVGGAPTKAARPAMRSAEGPGAVPSEPPPAPPRSSASGGAPAGASRSAPVVAATPAGAPAADTAATAGGGRRAPAATMRGPAARPLRVLTAATVADVDRRADFLGYLARHGGEAASTGIDLTRRTRFRVVDPTGQPIHDARVTLVGSGFAVEGRTHADGYWDFFPSFSAPQAGGPTTLYIQAGRVTAQAVVPLPPAGDGRDVVVRLPGAAAVATTAVDLAFLIDVTGSMGDELAYVNAEVVGVVDRVRAAVPQARFRVAATFYRDRGDAVPIEQIPFSTDLGAFTTTMSYVAATGGGDYPEDLNLGLAAALTTLQWSQEPAVRVLVVIADAPPQMYQDFQYTYRDAMADASSRGIRILPVAASGANRVVELIFRAMGAFTSTPYVYLTDDSGIGNPHMEADTESVSVEMFSDALTRLLVSDLQGQGMHEPGFQQAGIGAILPRQ